MSGDKYLIVDQHACYFLTFTVIRWIDIFTRREYRDIIIESLDYCIKNKGLTLYAWIIMSNHIHLVGEMNHPQTMSAFIRDFKKFTSRKINKTIITINESRRDWLLELFSSAAEKTGRAKKSKIWKDDNHAIDLTNNDLDIMQRIDYLHENPVTAGWVDLPDHYLYSSAMDYHGRKGLIEVKII